MEAGAACHGESEFPVTEVWLVAMGMNSSSTHVLGNNCSDSYSLSTINSLRRVQKDLRLSSGNWYGQPVLINLNTLLRVGSDMVAFWGLKPRLNCFAQLKLMLFHMHHSISTWHVIQRMEFELATVIQEALTYVYFWYILWSGCIFAMAFTLSGVAWRPCLSNHAWRGLLIGAAAGLAGF